MRYQDFGIKRKLNTQAGLIAISGFLAINRTDRIVKYSGGQFLPEHYSVYDIGLPVLSEQY